MHRSKGFRISQKKRKVEHAEKVLKEWGVTNPYEAKEQAKKLADNLKVCSCEACRNPRHSGYAKSQKLTTQELKSIEDFEEQKDEWI